MLKDNLKKLRKACGFKQEDVANVLGIDRSAYSYYESGKTEPSVKNLIKIARMFKVDVDTIVGNSEYSRCLQFNSEPLNEYDSQLNADLDALAKCSAEERALIAWFRQTENKSAVFDMIKSQCSFEE